MYRAVYFIWPFKIDLIYIMMIKSRIAPTPSGYLHIGNAFNFLLTWWLVRQNKGVLQLRIDDVDAPRMRPEYLNDIFYTLDWLGIDWDEGPFSAEQHHKEFSMQLRLPEYREHLLYLIEQNVVYACTCSRSDVAKGLPCNCAKKHKTALPQKKFAYKIKTDNAVSSYTDGWSGYQTAILHEVMPNFVVWRNDDLPAYQLFSVIEDNRSGVNAIVRGEDLLHTTAAQLFLADKLNMPSFCKTQFYHHPLLTDSNGTKLSKSAGALSLKNIRESGQSAQKVLQLFSNWLRLKTPVSQTKELIGISINEIRF